MKFWQLGNTSVRSAMRIRDGLIALSESLIQGNIRKSKGDITFRKLLGEYGVVSLGNDESNSVGRKWRLAMGKLGFIYPEIEKNFGFAQADLGQLDTITPAGWNLIRAETVPAMQECYLRAMVTPLSIIDEKHTFSPLCWTLALLLEIEHRKEQPSVTFIEMARIVQTTTPADGISETVDRILDLRTRRNASKNKRRFDQEEYKRGATELDCKPRTFIDYADMNIRYLKATGMVQSKGKDIALIPEKRALAIALTTNLFSDKPKLELYRSLCNGTILPTDNVKTAYQVLEDLLLKIQHYGIDYSIVGKPLDTPAHINQVRYEIEDLIAEKKEEIYANTQVKQWQEIAIYMDLIASHKKQYSHGDIRIDIPHAETSAYLEWSLWRAFLAINTLVNKPYKMRRFKIDQDFMPVSTAPGNGPDLIAEFDDCVIAIEVTLSENSRQEAMEGEPVRRHIADLTLEYKKPVYGLFIANRIDSNTAETFRIGVWYTRDDQKINLHIVPLTLAQFSSFFKMIFSTGTATPQRVIALLKECESYRHKCEAPQWKTVISEIIASRCHNGTKK